MLKNVVLAAIVSIGIAVSLLGSTQFVYSADAPPAWAYPITPSDFKFPPDKGEIRHVPGSSGSYTETQLRDRFVAKDWHPEEHPAMPEIVAFGRKPTVFACGHCHRPDGIGAPENS